MATETGPRLLADEYLDRLGFDPRVRAPDTDAEWAALNRLLPGYDPYRDADGYRFDPALASDRIWFCHYYIRHVEGSLAGKPFILEPWEQSIISNIFGWVSEDTGFRRFREVFAFIPRKNGKSSLCAVIVLICMFCDDEAGAQLYSAAAERDQAGLIFRMVKAMVDTSPELSSIAQTYQHSIAIESKGLCYKAISAKASTKHGYNPHMIACDETHAHKTRELIDTLETAMGARSQPLMVHTTTSDYERPESICNEKHAYACRVRDGVIKDAAFLPVIYEASRDDDWTDPAVWAAANPNLGVSLSMEYMRKACERAKELPTFENTFKRLHLNIRTEQDVRWLSLAKWDASPAENLRPGEWRRVMLDRMKGRSCYAALDLSSTTDLTALALLFPLEDNRFVILPWFWVPGASAQERDRRDRVPYTTWAREGYIETTDGEVVDYDAIRSKVNELGLSYKIEQLAIDRWNATHLMTQLMSDGLEVVPFGQGFASMSAPTKEFGAMVISGKVLHGGNPVLRWNASNATVEMDAPGNEKPSKRKSIERIDGIVACIMATGLWMIHRPQGRSVYDDGAGLIVL